MPLFNLSKNSNGSNNNHNDADDDDNNAPASPPARHTSSHTINFSNGSPTAPPPTGSTFRGRAPPIGIPSEIDPLTSTTNNPNDMRKGMKLQLPNEGEDILMGMGMDSDDMNSNPSSPPATTRRKTRFRCSISNLLLCGARNPQELLQSTLDNYLYKCVTFFFSMILMFGTILQSLVIPVNGDVVFDILYILALVFFIMDMVLRMIAFPNYFRFTAPLLTRMHNAIANRIRGKIGITNGGVSFGGDDLPTSSHARVVGSFMFWCDLLSTATLCYDISYINRAYYDSPEISISLNESGLPVGTLLCDVFEKGVCWR
jgi:hypothetical protein